MLKIPPEYKDKYQEDPCVPITTKYGKFLVKYHANKKTKFSKIQKSLDNNKDLFLGITKYEFLTKYLLDENYSLNDFLNIKDATLRGFLYEAIWDICIKCNTVSFFHKELYDHIAGKIETYDKIIVIRDMLAYLKKHNVRSSNEGGVSDITMRKGNHYILISIKSYIEEKSIFKTDIHKIEAIFKNSLKKANASATNHNILFVRNKRHFQNMKNRAQKEKKELFDKLIYDVRDETDLAKSLLCLRQFYKLLKADGFDKYLSHKPTLPIFIPPLHAYICYNLLQSWLYNPGNIRKVFNCCMSDILYSGIYLFFLLHRDQHIQVICSEKDKTVLTTMEQSFYIPDKMHISYVNYKNYKTSSANIVVFIGTKKDMDNAKIADTSILYIIHDYMDTIPENTKVVSFGMEHILSWKKDKVIKWEPSYVLEQALIQYYGITAYNIYMSTLESDTTYDIQQEYRKYPDVIPKICNGQTLDTQIENIFGTREDHKNKEWIYNQLKKQNASTGSGILWIVEPSQKDVLAKILQQNSVYQKIKEFNFNDHHVIIDYDHVQEQNITCSCIICMTDKMSSHDFYTYISECFTRIVSPNKLVVISNNSQTINLLLKKIT